MPGWSSQTDNTWVLVKVEHLHENVTFPLHLTIGNSMVKIPCWKSQLSFWSHSVHVSETFSKDISLVRYC